MLFSYFPSVAQHLCDLRFGCIWEFRREIITKRRAECTQPKRQVLEVGQDGVQEGLANLNKAGHGLVHRCAHGLVLQRLLPCDITRQRALHASLRLLLSNPLLVCDLWVLVEVEAVVRRALSHKRSKGAHKVLDTCCRG